MKETSDNSSESITGNQRVDASQRPYKLVAFDVDGTIADLETGIIPTQVRTAIHRVQGLGIPVVMTTGRAWVSAQEAAAQLGWTTDSEHRSDQSLLDKFKPGATSQGEYFVCSNGAVVAQFPPFDLLRLLTFEPGDVLDKLADIPNIMLAAEEFGVGYRVTRLFEAGLLQGKQTLVALDDLRATPCLKIIAHLAEGVDDDLHSYIANIDFGDLTVFRGTSHWYDLCPPTTSKANGLKVITDRLGIDRSEVLAFGDGFNDIEILEWAGRGVALGDAPEEVQRVADAVTPPFHEGGILPELARWFG